jgi:hypothetical protein
MDFQEKKSLVEKIATLSKEAHIEIFFLLQKHVPASDYTLTRNGAFFIVNQLSDSVMLQLRDLVDFCSQNEENLKLTHPDKKNIMVEKNPGKEEESSSSSSSSSEDEEEVVAPPPPRKPPVRKRGTKAKK